MPCTPPPYPSYMRRLSVVLLLAVMIHGGDLDPVEGRSAGDSHNKLESPVLEDGLLLLPCSGGHHGGGKGEGKKMTARSRRLGCGSFSSACMVKIRRLPWSMSSPAGLGNGVRLPATALPVTFLAERRPLGAMAPGAIRRQLEFFLPA